MNCESCQNLLSDFIDGSLPPRDRNEIEAHLAACPDCADARTDLVAIVDFCREHRGEYEAIPNEKAMWLRIVNILETEPGRALRPTMPAGAGAWFRLMNRSWQLSFAQLAAAVAGIVLVVSLGTVGGMRWFGTGGGAGVRPSGLAIGQSAPMNDRIRQQQQVIDYWNQIVELNKAR